jgi:filamentous hemagglutinin family protein
MFRRIVNNKLLIPTQPYVGLGEGYMKSSYRNTLIGSAIGVLLGVSSAFGNPTDPTVVAGSASFETAGSQLNVSNTPGAIIDWAEFSIGQGEVTNFIQQSASSAVLNRVTGGNISEILGGLQSNGQVFLINPNGLIMGEGAVIDTAGFIGSTLDIANDSFLAGNYAFSGEGGVIENRGLIQVGGDGNIALIATSVENSGVLRSENGDILLAAGRSVSVSFDGFEDLSFDVTAPAGEAINLGEIVARGGNASLVAENVSNDGNVELVESEDGRIFLHSIDRTTVSGSLSTDGGDVHIEGRQVELRNASVDTGGSEVGGDISLLGDNVGLFAGSKVDATGTNGGGTVLIGGEQQGRGDTRTSNFVYLDSAASVNADGGVNGDGGTVILFAENTVRVHGEVTAQGGTQSGDGGFVETSGLLGLDVRSAPDASAANGENGTWLIDPFDITVVEFLETGLVDFSLDGDNGDGVDVFTAIQQGLGSAAEIDALTIVDGLMNNDVVIDTGSTGSGMGNINIDAAIITNTDNTLTFNAAGDIFVNATVSLGAGTLSSLIFNAGHQGNLSARTFLGDGGADNGGLTGLPSLVAGTVEFNNGLIATDEAVSPFDIIANQIRINGEATITGTSLNLFSNSAEIESLTVEAGFSGRALINGDPNGLTSITIDSLNVSSAGNGFSSDLVTVEFINSEVTLTGISSIDLFSLSTEADPAAPSVIFHHDFRNEGVLNIGGTGTINFGFDEFGATTLGSFTNETSGVVNIVGGNIINSAQSFGNFGAVNILVDSNFGGGVGNTGVPVGIFGLFENEGQLNITDSAELISTELVMEPFGDLNLMGGNLILSDPGATGPIDLNFPNGSALQGFGSITTDGAISFEAGSNLSLFDHTLDPLRLFADVNLFAGAGIGVGLAGPAEFQTLEIFGNLVLGGLPGGIITPNTNNSVQFDFFSANGYVPAEGVLHNIITVDGTVSELAPSNIGLVGFQDLTAESIVSNQGVGFTFAPSVLEPPIIEEPPVEEPPVEEPPAEEPPAEEPPTSADQAAAEQAAAEQAAAEQAAAEQAAAEQAAAEQAAAEQAAAEQAAAERAAAERAAAEERAAEEQLEAERAPLLEDAVDDAITDFVPTRPQRSGVTRSDSNGAGNVRNDRNDRNEKDERESDEGDEDEEIRSFGTQCR